MTFQRARKPEEKELRRRAILAAARTLTTEVGANDFSLTELALRSGISKPNLYRYFESREEVLLHVWVEEVHALVEGIEQARTKRGDTRAIVKLLVGSFVALPLLGELMPLVGPVFERNLSVDSIVAMKRALLVLIARVARWLHAQLPTLSVEDCGWTCTTIMRYIAGTWPATHPGPMVSQALALPELAAFCGSFELDLERFLDTLFAGLTSRR